MEKPRKPGRPRKKAADRKTFMLRVRLTADEHQYIADAAEGNISEWARTILLRAAKRPVK